jgi:hypothetical protein
MHRHGICLLETGGCSDFHTDTCGSFDHLDRHGWFDPAEQMAGGAGYLFSLPEEYFDDLDCVSQDDAVQPEARHVSSRSVHVLPREDTTLSLLCSCGS